MNNFEPRPFQKEMFEKIAKAPRETLLQLPSLPRYTYGIDYSEGRDTTVVAHAKMNGNGITEVYFDEYANFVAPKWYRHPIAWWQWRRLTRNGRSRSHPTFWWRKDLRKAMENFDKLITQAERAAEEKLKDKHQKAILQLESIHKEEIRAAEERLLDFAKDVITQWGYEVSDGIYTSGGLSTLESAFSILRNHGLLDKKGRYDSKS